jgi:hypothetical protein
MSNTKVMQEDVVSKPSADKLLDLSFQLEKVECSKEAHVLESGCDSCE